ncbi:unnamed protein product [Caretta caretta]
MSCLASSGSIMLAGERDGELSPEIMESPVTGLFPSKPFCHDPQEGTQAMIITHSPLPATSFLPLQLGRGQVNQRAQVTEESDRRG